ncbi:hypothetical protein SAMN02799630_00776 [Paenibacillus sp. UNCCL117]|uniref:hypothetical protein n=1 Tax=unclassified Paenibacillus TaxID=185978 RepID=UPI00088AFF6C|nr:MULTISPECIES: hypothetical protein [unclassified Paenibacillus]SDC19858.1 hypothetical protein SAMN04488602_101576 [Paenibacillus sp. cl123]SFW18496.1 hypothetical protein SAMN02799630_00776 [Paenibacillus sp. UNCCL117]
MISMTPVLYLISYPFVWWGIFYLVLGLSRLRLRALIQPLLVSTMLLSMVSVALQLNDLTYLTGIVQPVCAIVCLWLLFKFRLAHSILILFISYFCIGVLEYVVNLVLAKFDPHTALLYYQTDLFITPFLLFASGFLLYQLLHYYRWGFTFVSPAPSKLLTSSLSARWMLFLLLTAFLSANLAFSIYFYSHWVVPSIFGHTAIWGTLLLLSYRRELRE